MSEQVAAVAASVSPTPESVSKSEQVSESTNEISDAELDAAEAEEADAEGNEVKADSDDKSKKKTEKELEKRIKKLKLKVDGKEIEEELDLDNDEDLVRHLQMAKMGQKRAQEKAELENEFRKFFKALQDDPLALLAQEFQMNPDDLIQSYIDKQMEIAKKTPEQIEREKMEAELKALKEERSREKEELEKKELERLQQQEFERYDMLMEQALAKNNIPKNEYYIKKIADFMLVGIEKGFDVTPEDVIPLVKEELNTDVQKLIQLLPEEDIEALLGEQVINKLRKRRLAKAQEAKKMTSKPKIEDTGKDSKGSSDDKPRDKVSYKDFFKM